MYLNPAPDGFILGEKLAYKLVLPDSGRGEGGPTHLNNTVSQTFLGLLPAIVRLTSRTLA
jgi:hypothetical protein